MPPDKAFPHYCGQVREEVQTLTAELRVILEKIHEVDTKVAVLIDRERPPCEELRGRIDDLKNTKSYLQGGWAIVIIIMSSLGFLSPLIFAGLKLWK